MEKERVKVLPIVVENTIILEEFAVLLDTVQFIGTIKESLRILLLLGFR